MIDSNKALHCPAASKKPVSRRTFLHAAGAAGAAGMVSPLVSKAAGAEAERSAGGGVKLGFDNFSIRAFGWKAPKLIEYAASLKVDTLLLSDLNVYESLDDAYLKKIREQAKRAGVELQAGTGSICPTSGSYNEKRWGRAEDHARLLIRVAKALGTPVARCYQGHAGDRNGDGGIFRHIEETVKVCKAVQSRAEDAGVKIAIENHAGDMQAWELKSLIEAAGPHFVGATMDPGNAAWTLEDPMVNLEVLAPYVVTTGIRDSMIWENDTGASVMWANMGDGLVDWSAYTKKFTALCTGVPFVLEIISYKWQKDLPYLTEPFWKRFPDCRAHEFARFVALAKKGRKFTLPEGRPEGKRGRDLEQAQQRFDLEASLTYCRNVLKLGAAK